MTAPVASAGPETNSAPVTSLEIAEPAVENEQVADAEAVQASREEIVAASPEARLLLSLRLIQRL